MNQQIKNNNINEQENGNIKLNQVQLENKENAELIQMNTFSHEQIINYENTESPVTFCCNSKKRIYLKFYGAPSFAFYFTFFFLIVPIGSLNIFAYPKTKNDKMKLINYLIGDIILFLTLLSYLNVVTSCPGYEDTSKIISRNEFEERNPVQVIKNLTIKLKYCETCKIIRNLRTFHCRYCNKCVLRQDHHCAFINNCVGKNNHLKFLIFIFFCTIYCLYCSIFSIAFPVIEKKKHLGTFRIGYLVILAIIAICMFMSMIFFTISHIILISNNQTTREEIRGEFNEKILDNGCIKNWKEIC